MVRRCLSLFIVVRCSLAAARCALFAVAFGCMFAVAVAVYVLLFAGV